MREQKSRAGPSPGSRQRVPEQNPAETKTVVIKEGAAAAPAAKPAPPKKTDTEKRKEEGLDW